MGACTLGDSLPTGAFEESETQLTGPYTLTITGAPECNALPISTFVFDVRAVVDAPSGSIRLVLPGEQYFEVIFCRTCTTNPRDVYASVSSRQRAPVPRGLFLSLGGTLKGVLEPAGGGRGKVTKEAVYDGFIQLSRAPDFDPAAVGQCGTATPNSWKLEPR